jgi:hypothetical protein
MNGDIELASIVLAIALIASGVIVAASIAFAGLQVARALKPNRCNAGQATNLEHDDEPSNKGHSWRRCNRGRGVGYCCDALHLRSRGLDFYDRMLRDRTNRRQRLEKLERLGNSSNAIASKSSLALPSLTL